jgi:hypothetical protein
MNETGNDAARQGLAPEKLEQLLSVLSFVSIIN